jgi:hypothetical protein
MWGTFYAALLRFEVLQWQLGSRGQSEGVPMRVQIVRLLAVVFICMCGSAAATPIVYNVYISGAGETVTGTFTTDGTIGPIAFANIVSWHLVASGALAAFTIASNQVGSTTICFASCGLAATQNTLAYDFSAPSPPDLLQLQGPNVIDTIQFAHGQLNFFINSGVFVGAIPFSGSLIIGTAVSSVPEPGTLMLLGVALAGLGFARKRFPGNL